MRTVLLSLLILLVISVSAMADVTYSYTGNPFTTTTSPYSSANYVTVSFTTASPLGGNLSDFIFVPVQFSFYDQLFGLNNTTPSVSAYFQVSTDANGAFTNWFMWAFDGHSYIETIRLPILTWDYARHDGNEFAGNVQDAPGQWGADPVPEPSGLLLLGGGMATLAGVIRRRISK